jgi:hypothetical protein
VAAAAATAKKTDRQTTNNDKHVRPKRARQGYMKQQAGGREGGSGG